MEVATFGRHLKRVMQVAGVKQDTLANALNLSQGQVSKLVNDHVEPTLEQVDIAATCCKCSRWTLIGGTLLADKFGGDCIVSLDPEAHMLLAYFASALTGLSEQVRGEIFDDAKVVREACEKMGALLYEPADYTDPVRHAQLHPQRVYEVDHAQVSRSDFLVLDTRCASFGAGQELEIAKNEGLPIVVLIPRGIRPSRMVTGTCARLHHIEFASTDELRRGLDSTLPILATDLLDRRRPTAVAHGDDSFRARLKSRRETLHLDYAAVGRHVGLAPHGIEQLEKGLFPNPSLRILEGLALALDTSISYLVDGVMRNIEEVDTTLRRSKDSLHRFADDNGLTRQEAQTLWTNHMVKFSEQRYSVAEARAEAVNESGWQERYDELKSGHTKMRQLRLDNDD